MEYVYEMTYKIILLESGEINHLESGEINQ